MNKDTQKSCADIGLDHVWPERTYPSYEDAQPGQTFEVLLCDRCGYSERGWYGGGVSLDD